MEETIEETNEQQSSQEDTQATTPGVSKKERLIPSNQYIEAVGRRKTSVARVRITEIPKTKKPSFTVNNKEMSLYFPLDEEQALFKAPLVKLKALSRFSVSARVYGGGRHAQAEAVRHGLARALVRANEEWRSRLKKGGLLKRDPRAKERKKFGKKKARKSPQWSKR